MLLQTDDKKQLIRSLVSFCIRRRGLVLFICCLLSLPLLYGASLIEISSNYREMFSERNPDIKALDAFQAQYGKSDNIVFVVVPKSGNSFQKTTLELVQSLTKEAWQTPYARRVDSLTNFQHSTGSDDTVTVEPLLTPDSAPTLSDINRIKTIALSDPLVVGRFVTRDSKATAITVTLQFNDVSEEEVPEAVGYAYRLRDQMEARYPDHKIYLTGIAVLNDAFRAAVLADLATLVPGMYGVMILMLIITMRSPSACVSVLATLTFSTIAAMGLAGLFGATLTAISAAAPTIVLTIAVADAVHILTSYQQNGAKGMPKDKAITQAVADNFTPLTITSLTTAVGFLVLNFSEAPPFWHLGNIAAAGIVAAWILSLTLLPAIIAMLPSKTKPLSDKNATRYIMRYAHFLVRFPKPILLGLGSTALILLWFVPSLTFNDTYVTYFDETTEFRRDAEQADKYFGIYLLEFDMTAGAPNAVHNPDYQQQLAAFTSWLKVQPKITHVSSFSDTVKKINRNINADDPGAYALPASQEQSAQYLLLYEMSLAYGQDLNDLVNLDRSATRLTATLKSVSSQEIAELLEKTASWHREQTGPGIKTIMPTGPTVLFNSLSERNVKSMRTGMLLSILLIALLMGFAFKSVKLGFLSLVPNLIPLAVTFGIWALLVGYVGFSVAAVAAISLGIIVDDTIYFMSTYVRAIRERGVTKEQAVLCVFEKVGSAIARNTLILATGFLYLVSSSFKLNQDMGMLTAIAITVAFLFDFALLPTLLLIKRQ